MNPVAAASCAVLALALGAGPNPDLAAAQAAFNDARYQEVLPLLARALAGPLAQPERRAAYELQAMTHAAFDEKDSAIDSFRHALGVDLQYEPGAVSPKVRALFDEARARGALLPPLEPPEQLPAGASPPPGTQLESRTALPPTRIAALAALGGGVAAIGVGAIFGVRSAHALSAETSVTYDTAGRVDNLTQRQAFQLDQARRTDAIIANTLVGAGAVLAAAAGVLWWSGGRTTVAAGPGGVQVRIVFRSWGER